MNNKTWIALFSQTGSEICNLAENLGRWPDLIITDNISKSTYDKRLLISRSIQLIAIPYRKLSKEDKIKYYRAWFDKEDIITLHGWLNIVPEEICNEYTIYNGHPGLITDYPELKGKDPQIRVWENFEKYPYIGSVVHRVVPEVDAGEIMNVVKIKNECLSVEEVFNSLKKTSLNSWLYFLNTIK